MIKRTWRLRISSVGEILLGLGILTDWASAMLLAGVPGLGNPLTSVLSLAAYTTLASALLMIVLVGILRLRGLKVRTLFLGRRKTIWPEIKVGLATVPAVFVLVIVLKLGFRHFLPAYYSGAENILEELTRTPGDLLLFVFVAFFTGGLKEEFQRGFLIRRFEAGWGPAWLGAVLLAIPFGFAHRIQGTDEGMIAGLLGLGWGLLYLHRGSLVAPMVSHALYDAVEICRYYYFGPMTFF